jgi:hypothetical protein
MNSYHINSYTTAGGSFGNLACTVGLFWDAFYPTLKHKEEDCFCEIEEQYSSLEVTPLLSTRQIWEVYSSDEESDFEYEPPPLRSSRWVLEGSEPEEVELTPYMDAHFVWDAPDLKDGGEWCDAHLKKIRTITQSWHGMM